MLTAMVVGLLLRVGQPALDPSGAWQLNQGLSQGAVEAYDIALAPWLHAPTRIVLRLADETVTFYDEDGLRRIYRLGSSTTVTDARGDRVGARATWDGATLRIEHRLAARRQIIEAFSVSAVTHQLTVTIVVREGGASGLEWIRHVYDPVR